MTATHASSGPASAGGRFVALARKYCSAVAAVALLLPLATEATGADKLVFATNWYAEAEHGGFYQALAEGIYAKHGLDVAIRMGGPQLNVYQLLLAGQADLAMGYDIATLNAIERGLPLVTIAATFQRDPAVLIAHPGVADIVELRTRTLLIGQASETTFWPWLKAKYGFSDAQKRPYSFSVQQFLADPNVAQQGYATSEPYSIEKGGVTPKVFLLADYGYPPYAETIVATSKTLQEKPDVLRRFVEATALGWKSYLANPKPGNALIKKVNPQIEDDLLAFSVAKMKEFGLVTGGDAATQGILTMSDARWKDTFQFMAQAGLINPDTDYRKAYTLEIVRQVKVLP
ncbi:MAG TPA: ABC transporter substrate-binding protein [Casimicrobiaceae bacterium]|nr:ABC transporter substrate-binding protein [Casimicrobiaceae bacterium]